MFLLVCWQVPAWIRQRASAGRVERLRERLENPAKPRALQVEPAPGRGLVGTLNPIPLAAGWGWGCPLDGARPWGTAPSPVPLGMGLGPSQLQPLALWRSSATHPPAAVRPPSSPGAVTLGQPQRLPPPPPRCPSRPAWACWEVSPPSCRSLASRAPAAGKGEALGKHRGHGSAGNEVAARGVLDALRRPVLSRCVLRAQWGCRVTASTHNTAGHKGPCDILPPACPWGLQLRPPHCIPPECPGGLPPSPPLGASPRLSSQGHPSPPPCCRATEPWLRRTTESTAQHKNSFCSH